MLTATRAAGFDTLTRINAAGYTARLVGTELRVRGGGAPGPELRALALEHKHALKAAVLLSDPPGWLATLFDLYWSGRETGVRLTSPATGNAEVFLVRVSLKNIAAAVAAEVGAPVLEWERLLPEVEEAIGT